MIHGSLRAKDVKVGLKVRAYRGGDDGYIVSERPWAGRTSWVDGKSRVIYRRAADWRSGRVLVRFHRGDGSSYTRLCKTKGLVTAEYDDFLTKEREERAAATAIKEARVSKAISAVRDLIVAKSDELVAAGVLEERDVKYALDSGPGWTDRYIGLDISERYADGSGKVSGKVDIEVVAALLGLSVG